MPKALNVELLLVSTNNAPALFVFCLYSDASAFKHSDVYCTAARRHLLADRLECFPTQPNGRFVRHIVELQCNSKVATCELRLRIDACITRLLRRLRSQDSGSEDRVEGLGSQLQALTRKARGATPRYDSIADHPVSIDYV